MPVWEILVPVAYNDGTPVTSHETLEAWIVQLVGGLTKLPVVDGWWESPCGKVYAERMIPYRVACDGAQIDRIATVVGIMYKQLAVMFHMVAAEARIKTIV